VRILYFATSFPEPSKGATIYTDLAEALHKSGHEITVAVSEQARNKKFTEINIERGFEVLRIVVGNFYDVGYVEKGITTLKLPLIMKQGIKKFLGNRNFDLILFEAPPVTNANLVAWAKKKFQCPAYLMLKDIFPQNAIDLNIIKPKGLLSRYFTAKEKKMYRTSDIIGCMSIANKEYIINHNAWLDPNKVKIFPNTKKITEQYQAHGNPMRSKLGIPRDACVFLFGGNMGRPQYVELLCTAIKECKNEEKIFFLFVGRGTDRNKLEETIREHGIKNALVIENLPRSEYEQITKECDVGLIVLSPRFTFPNYPSRILSYMEFAKPVLAATDMATDFKELIEDADCGEWVWSGDDKTFVDKIKEMSICEELISKGYNGRKYIEKNLTVENSVKLLEQHLKKPTKASDHFV
jgi:glycosyltransferase involved in cell wall biosynthesis